MESEDALKKITGKTIKEVIKGRASLLAMTEIVFEDDSSLQIVGEPVFKLRSRYEREHEHQYEEQGWFGFSGKKYVCRICGKTKVGGI